MARPRSSHNETTEALPPRVLKSRKRPLKEVEDPKTKCVTFTKRRNGLFSKAAEMCLLCDAQVAILVPAVGTRNKFYNFGSTNIGTVVDAFVGNEVPQPIDPETTRNRISMSCEIKELESQLNQISKSKKFGIRDPWAYLEELLRYCNTIEELQLVKDILEKLRNTSTNIIKSSTSLQCPSSASNSSTNVDANDQTTSIAKTTAAFASASDFDFLLDSYDLLFAHQSTNGGVILNSEWDSSYVSSKSTLEEAKARWCSLDEAATAACQSDCLSESGDIFLVG